MEIEKTKGYGVAMSDLEGNWDETFKKKLKTTSQKIIFKEVSFKNLNYWFPNCYADDLAHPDYFKKFGIKYSRKGTIANGAKCCDLWVERMI